MVTGDLCRALLAGEPEIHEEGGGFAVVAGEIAQERVEDVVVELDLRVGHAVPMKSIARSGQLIWSEARFMVGAWREAIMIRGIKFVSVPVRDQDAALKFWTEKCGFKVATDQAFGPQRWIELMIPGADTGLVLFTMDGDEARIGTAQPSWCGRASGGACGGR